MRTLIILIALVVLAGCHPTRKPCQNDRPYGMYADTVWGHIYITTSKAKGLSTIHAEHCTCKGGTR